MAERNFYLIESEPKKTSLQAEFIGFSEEKKRRVKNFIEDTALPTEIVNKVVWAKAPEDQKNVLGTYQPETRTLTILDNIENVPQIAQYEVVPHELAHGASPFDPRNENIYGSKEAQEASRAHVVAVAKQSLDTKKYLNGYQAYLAKQLERGEIDTSRFVEETSAILIGLRFTNTKHLEQVDAAQKTQIKKMGGNKPVDLLTTNEQASAGKVSGVDMTISSLIPNLRTKQDIDNHVTTLKRKYGGGKKLLPNISLPLAA